MAAQSSKENKHSFASIILVLVLFGSLAVLVFVPVGIFESVRDSEQASIQNWLGQEADQWVMLQIFEFLQAVNREANQALDSAAFTGNDKIDGWFSQRIYATLVWGHVVLYRSGVLLMWGVFAIPVVLATVMDGYWRREISKTNFSSQSPVLHKSGMDTTKATLALMLAWVFIPWHISMVVAPIGIFTIGAAAWLWISNAPKRI